MDNISLNNWSVVGAKWVAVEVYQLPYENTFVYNPTVVVCLEDFKQESSTEEQKVVSITTDRFFTDSKIAASFLFNLIKDMFNNISSTVFVYNKEHEKILEYNIADFMDFTEVREKPRRSGRG